MPFKDPEDRKRNRSGYWKTYYADPTRRAKHQAAVKAAEVKRVARVRKWLDDYKLEKGCKVCGFKEHPAALDFDHRDPSTKEFNIAEFDRRGVGFERLQKEVAKCDVLCANHHRMKHFGVLEEPQSSSPCHGEDRGLKSRIPRQELCLGSTASKTVSERA